MQKTNEKQELLRIFYCILFLVFYTVGYTQSHTYTHYTVEDGLPSSSVYSAFQDSKGYMWFATNAGVSCFNGYEFKNFDQSDGLTDNTVFLITEDPKGRIWFGTFSCQLSYYENDSVYPYKFNDIIKEKLVGKHVLCSINVDEAENVLLGLDTKGICSIDKMGDLSFFSEQNGASAQIQTIISNGKVNYGFCRSDSLVQTNIEFQFKNNNELKKVNYSPSFSSQGSITSLSVVCVDSIIYFQDFLQSIYAYNKRSNTLQKLTLPEVLHHKKRYFLFYDKELLYVCTEKEGVYQFSRDGDSLILQNQLLKGESIARVFKDNQGGYWFSSLNNGVFYCPSFLITNNLLGKYINEVNPANQVLTDQSDNLFFNIKGKGVYRKNLSSNSFEAFETERSTDYSSCYYDKKTNRTVVATGNKVYSHQNEVGKTFLGETNSYTKKIISDSTKIYYFNYYYIGLFVDSTSQLNEFKFNKEQLFRTCFTKFKEKVWIGTNKKIERYPKSEQRPSFLNHKYLSSGISSLTKLNSELLLVGTKSYGLVIVNNEQIIAVINTSKGLASNSIKAIHVDGEKTIWVGTNKGVSRINYQNSAEFKVVNLTKKHGLPSEEVFSICSYHNQLVVSTKKGLSVFNKTKVNINNNQLPVYITRFSVNSEDRAIKEKQALTYKENFINISFEGLNYRSLGEIEYQYRMLGVDTNWVSTVSRTKQYPTLQSNDYTFEVRAKNEDGVWSSPAKIAFTVKPPFWLTWWFIVLEIALGLSIIYAVFRYREKQLLTKSDIEKKMIELELKALRSQMNPHFIFNTLNTIQNAVNNLDKKITSNYIAKFGKLIRIVLESSKNPIINLDTEIEMLSLYIDLEAVRFSNKFTYNLTVDPQLEEDIYQIPTMVIQPFIENAIIHGLTPKQADNLVLTIEFSLKDEQTLYCIIEDNGIGRKEASKIIKMNKTSMGMDITQERLNLYDKEIDKRFAFKIIDLMINNKPSGTRAEIIFTV